MPDPAWAGSPPEANYLRLAGPGAAGAASTLASAAGWQALAAGGEISASASTLNASATAPDFQGVGGLSSVAAAGRLNSTLHLLAGWVQAKPPVAQSAVAAYQAAVSAMVPAEVSLANRTEHAANVVINPLVFGALTPVIVALDATYFGEHWPHNAGVGIAYGATLAGLAASLAVPPPVTPPGASPAGPAAAAAALAQSAGRAASGEALTQAAEAAATAGKVGAAPVEAVTGPMASALSQPLQAASAVQQPLLGMFGLPLAAFQSPGQRSPSWSMAGEDIGLELGRLPLSDGGPTDGHGMPAVAAALGVVGSGGGVSGTAGGAVAGALAGAPATTLTTYSRPAASFDTPGAPRPPGQKAGLLNAAELRGPTTSAPAGGLLPVSPGHAGAMGQTRNDDRTEARARVVTGNRIRHADPA